MYVPIGTFGLHRDASAIIRKKHQGPPLGPAGLRIPLADAALALVMLAAGPIDLKLPHEQTAEKEAA